LGLSGVVRPATDWSRRGRIASTSKQGEPATIVRQFILLVRSYHMADYKRLDVNEVGDVTVVRFKDKKIVEDINIEELGRELFQLVEQDNRRKLLLNFSSVDFLSSAALGKLITLEKKVRAHGGVLKLSNIRPEIYEVFTITKLDRLFDIKKNKKHTPAPS
jgi:anti-sigma B factor antagonist